MTGLPIQLDALSVFGTCVLLVDQDDCVQSLSASLRRLLQIDELGWLLSDRLQPPQTPIEAMRLLRSDGKSLPLRGGWVPFANGQRAFAGSPAPVDAEELAAMDLQITDFLANDSWTNFIIHLDETIASQREAERRIEQLKEERRKFAQTSTKTNESRRASLNMLQDLEHARTTAETATKAKSDFLANMSHEIRTPLNGVIGMLDLLRGTELNDKQLQYTQVGTQSANSLLSLINDILDFSKIEAGKLELDSTDFALTELMEEVGDILAYTLEQKNVELVISSDPQLPRIMTGDPTRLRQMMLNLANNAVKFTDQGEVVIRANIEKLGDGDVTVKISVTDTGVGIAPDRIGRLFKSFSQVDASTTRKYGGTGLGLAISSQLAMLMGGHVGVKSELGIGSTFWFTAQLAFPATQPQAESCEYAVLDGLRILVVDDCQTNRDILQEQLSRNGMVVELADSGESALPLVRQAVTDGQPFSLALLDMRMPGMSGLDLARSIRADESLCDTRLVLLSSIGNDVGIEQLRDAGFEAYMSKPLKASQLARSLRGALQRADARYEQDELAASEESETTSDIPLSILLAEDNEINQMVASEILKRSGMSCQIACNGQEAFEAVKTGEFDMVLMDCQMPVMDGFAATEAIRQWEQSPDTARRGPSHIPIIALTANAVKGDRERCLEVGMDEYLSKPLDPELLIKTLKEFGAKMTHQDNTEATSHDAAGSDEVPQSDGVPIDFDALTRRCMDDKQFALEILNKFRLQADEMFDKVQRGFAASNGKETGAAAHSIKGAAANIGAERLRQAAAVIEAAGMADDLGSVDGSLEELRSSLDLVMDYIPKLSEQAKAA